MLAVGDTAASDNANFYNSAKMETIRQGLRKASGFRKHAASVHTGRAFRRYLGLNSMWNQTSGAIKWVDR